MIIDAICSSKFITAKKSKELIEKLEGFHGYKLTNRIRLNSELSNFIACVMRIRGRNNRRDYPSVMLVYANDAREAGILLESFAGEDYVYIRDSALSQPDTGARIESVDAMEATCKEFDRVVMLLDETFYYDEDGYLRSIDTVKDDRVRNVYHGLGRAKKKIALIVKENGQVFDGILDVLQKRDL